jgi:hypothetical protein
MRMQPGIPETKSHYDRFLAEQYLWMAGGFEVNAAKNRQFFSVHHIRPRSRGLAIDLGAGCGFQSIPLAQEGFRVTAVDFSRPMLYELRERGPDDSIDTVAGDILDFPLWAGRMPELITCMGDTLTHLPDHNTVRSLIWQCHAELETGGKLILSFRDYSGEPEGSVAIIPVRSDAGRRFVCRLAYHTDCVTVTDILFSRSSGSWERSVGTYTKLKIDPVRIRDLMEQAGFRVDRMSTENGMVTFIAVKP